MPPQQLIDLAKNYLNITWIDEETNKKITTIVSNAIVDLDTKSGVKNDYTIAGKAQELFLMRVLYEWSNCLDDFYVNYRSEIIAFINQAKVKAYAKSQES